MEGKILPLRKKVKFEEVPTEWKHHRGGWSFALNQLRPLHASDGILLISAVEEWVFAEKTISEPWIGFVHQVARNNYPWYPDLERLVQNSTFLRSLDKCRGLFVFSHIGKEFLTRNIEKPVPIVSMLYPGTPFPEHFIFDWNRFEAQEKKRVLFIGEYLRNYQAFCDLVVPTTHQKYLLKSPDVDFSCLFDCNKQKIDVKFNDSVTIKEWVPDDEYDELLSSSIVFLNLYDAAAITTVVECLSRNTPLVINRLAAVEEYLGSSYPLFYDTLEEAAKLISNNEMLKNAEKYLKSYSGKSLLTPEKFTENFICSAVYRTLPLPSSQKHDLKQTNFVHFDVTIMIISYKRVYNLANLLKCFQNQDFTGSFEMIIWNNNERTQEEVKNICDPFMKDLNIRLIQSSQNYYCVVRLAAMRLMQSDNLLVCDDDVIPSPSYISSFLSKIKEYGPNAVICCRGHVFEQHSLNEEQPNLVWESYDHLKFFDETITDCQVSGIFLQFLKMNYYFNCILCRYTFFMLTAVLYHAQSCILLAVMIYLIQITI